jgi:hypothetical protein
VLFEQIGVDAVDGVRQEGTAIGAEAADRRPGVERPVRSITNFAEALGVTYAGAANNLRELIAVAWPRRWRHLPEVDPVSGGGGGVASGVSSALLP